ncbi:MAG TPA: TonB-dependent receptor [Thermoanaerobaculia bacterium]|nr:TonB-dependent receptor [Thermoanaerobaculia bacterium]
MSHKRIVQAILCLILVAAPIFAQTSSTTGEINGSVADNTGAVLPGVTVTATNTKTGLTRTVYTDSEGRYSIPLLSPGTYRVRAELAGLGQEERSDVRVFLGQTANIRFSLNPQIAEEITVTAASPLVDTTQSAAAAAVTQSEIENLPILGRDFKDLILLTPGVAPSFGGRVALVGARGTAVDFNIDGANANSDFFAEERGGTEAPYVFSQAAIQEFQVIRTTYSAEYSRGGGGTMNAITKSGTNSLTGEVFYYHRDEDWAEERSLPPGIFEFFEPRNADQYGFAVGGPIVRDTLFYFVNSDFQDISEPFNAESFLTDDDFLELDAATQQAFISRIEQLTGTSIAEQYSYETRQDQDTWLVKFDWNLGASNHVNARWNSSDYNNFPSESSGSFSNQGDEYNTVNSLVSQMDSILSLSLYNFLLAQYSLEERPINPLNTSFPQIGISLDNTFFFGQRDFLPNGTDEEKLELKDTLSWMTGDHTFKGGFNYLTVDVANLFVRDRAGDFRFDSVQDFLDNNPFRFEQGAGVGTGSTDFDFNQWGLFLMDTWRPNSQLTLDFGVRYDAQSMPQPSQNIYEATNPELDDVFNEDDDNIAPRFGFAYDLAGDGRSVIRGGVGMYYNFLPAILLAQPLQQTSGLFNNYVFNCTQVECPTFPNLFTPAQLQNPSVSPELATISPDFEAAESIRGSLGYERELARGYSFEVEGVYATHDKQQRFVNVNVVPTGIMFGDIRQYTLPPAQDRPYPEFTNVRMHVSDAEGEYTSATVGLRKAALDAKLAFQAHYTWSEAIDQDTNSRSTSTSFSLDPFDASVSEGPSDTDVTHRFVASATYELPWGFLVSGIYNWRTGQPYTRFIDFDSFPFNLTGIERVFVDVPVFVDNSGNVIDITQASGSTPAEFAAFLAERGARNIGRNTENQPDFSNFDLRLAKRFGLPGGVELELIAEVFNVFNETNTFVTSSRQNEFDIRVSGGKYIITRNQNFGQESGLDFNSPPRQYQGAIKVRF